MQETIFPSIQANCIYEGSYLLGTAIARPVIAKRQVMGQGEGLGRVGEGGLVLIVS